MRRGIAALFMRAAGCTFISMAGPSLSLSISRFRTPSRRKSPAALRLLLIAMLIAMCGAFSASAWASNDFEPATLVEAAQYIPCSDACSVFDSPVGAYCFRVGGRVVVGENSGSIRGEKLSGPDDMDGMQVSLRFSRWFIWMKSPDGSSLRLKRGSLFEGFTHNACVAEVHKPILAHAGAVRKKAKVPYDAIAIAGSGRGDFQPLFLWYQCAMESDQAGIGCQRWYVNGDSAGKDWYCAQTENGASVGATFNIDQLLSQAGRLVLTSGEVLQHDNRGRTNDKLDRPGESCR
jgi:hypothetical protein